MGQRGREPSIPRIERGAGICDSAAAQQDWAGERRTREEGGISRWAMEVPVCLLNKECSRSGTSLRLLYLHGLKEPGRLTLEPSTGPVSRGQQPGRSGMFQALKRPCGMQAPE